MARIAWVISTVAQRWIGWQVKRKANRGDYDDPITQRRRRAKEARWEE